MTQSDGHVRQLASYQVRASALDKVLPAIRRFVDYVRTHEPGTLRYEVWQRQDDPTKFVHIFDFRDEAANQRHSESKEVKEFAAVLYPECLAPVDFVDYDLITTNRRD